MTDLAQDLARVSAHIDRIGVTSADVISVTMNAQECTVHLHSKAADRLAAAWGDMGTHTTKNLVEKGLILAFHHCVEVRDSNIKFVWVILPTTTLVA